MRLFFFARAAVSYLNLLLLRSLALSTLYSRVHEKAADTRMDTGQLEKASVLIVYSKLVRTISSLYNLQQSKSADTDTLLLPHALLHACLPLNSNAAFSTSCARLEYVQ